MLYVLHTHAHTYRDTHIYIHTNRYTYIYMINIKNYKLEAIDWPIYYNVGQI